MRIPLYIKLFLAFLGMLALTYFFPVVHIQDSGTILSAATFLYGILYGFQTFRVMTNFAQLKVSVAVENAGLVAIFYLSKLLDETMAKRVEDRIERYLIAAINAPLSDHSTKTDKEFYQIFEPLNEKNVNVQGHHESYALNYIYEGFYHIPPSRNQVSQLATREIDKAEWAILIVLAILLIGILLLTRSADTISLLSTVIFSTTVVESLIILDAFDSNRIGEATLEYSSFNGSLRAMGKLPYYPESAIKQRIVKIKRGATYRVGMTEVVNGKSVTKIKVVTA